MFLLRFDRLPREHRFDLDVYGSINALAESFFATLECELIDRRRFRSKAETKMAVFDFIEGWYNPHRRHFALDYKPPVSYENERLVA